MVQRGKILGSLESVGANGTDRDGLGRFARASRVKFCSGDARKRSRGV